MFNFFKISTFIVTVALFAATSQAITWNWNPSKSTSGNFVAEVQDGACKSLVTVYQLNYDDGRGPPGHWRVAFDKSRFINKLGSWGFTARDAMEYAEKIFYSDYCGTENYNPTCPRAGMRPLSQLTGSCQ